MYEPPGRVRSFRSRTTAIERGARMVEPRPIFTDGFSIPPSPAKSRARSPTTGFDNRLAPPVQGATAALRISGPNAIVDATGAHQASTTRLVCAEARVLGVRGVVEGFDRDCFEHRNFSVARVAGVRYDSSFTELPLD